MVALGDTMELLAQRRMRRIVLGFVLLFALGDGCNNGVVGVQDYGSVTGRVLDATTNKPIPNAIVSVGSLFTASADIQGAFTMPRIPIGDQEVTARSPGFITTSGEIEILKNKTASIGYLRLVPVTKPAAVPTLPAPATPAPAPSDEATWSPPTPSPAASAAPSAAIVTPAAAVPAVTPSP